MKKIKGFISLILILLCILFITKDTLSISEWYNKYNLLQIIPFNSVQTTSYITLNNIEKDEVKEIALENGEGIAVSYLMEKDNKVYFGGYGSSNNIYQYDYTKKEIVNLGKIDSKYESINPFSQNLFISLNNGYGKDGGYNSGFCYLENKWICNDIRDSDFQIVNGAVYKDYIYALAIPTNINDKASRIIKFNKEFEILEETYLNTYELIDNMIYFYQYNDRLFLIGVDSLLGYLKIVEVDENLQITNIKKYNDLEALKYKTCTPYSIYEKSEGEFYIELSCESGNSSIIQENDNYILSINLKLDNYISYNINNQLIKGVDFLNKIIFTQDTDWKSNSKIKFHIYDLNMNHLNTIELEQQKIPILIDVSSYLIN